MRYLVLTPNLGLWYPKGSHFDLISYFDADYARCKVDRKSTSKKQNSVVLSTTEV
jgi:hypothetical protein